MNTGKKRGFAEPARLLENYLRTPKRLTPEFIAELDLRRANEVAPELRVTPLERRIIHAKRLVERTVEDGYYPEVMGMPSAQVPEIRTFTEHWREDESGHDLVLTAFLEATGEPLEDFRLPYAPVSTMWFSLMPERAAIALPMAWGFLNEAETYAGYACMGRKTRNPTLRRLLLEGLAPEELAHKAFYGGIAKYYLQGAPFSQAVVRLIMRKLWKGVGGDILPPAVMTEMLRYMFGGNAGYFSRSVGRCFREIPGMKDFFVPELSLEAAGIG